MLKKATALLLVCAGMGTWMGCGTTSSRYLFAAVPNANDIVIYREDPNSGVLTQLAGSPVAAGQSVHALALHPSGKFLYAANSFDNNISLYTVSSTGGLTEVTRTPVGTSPTLMVMDSGGSFLYVANSGSFDISVFSIDSSSGLLTAVPQANDAAAAPIGLSAMNIALAPSGSMLYVTGQPGTLGFVEAFPISAGVLSQPVAGSPFVTGNRPFGLAIDSSGTFLYTANTQDGTLSEFTINADGSLTALSGSPVGETFTSPVSLLIDKSGKYLYVANQGSTNVAAYTIGSDGTLTLLTNSPFATSSGPSLLATDSGGKYIFVGSQTTAAIGSFSLDSSTGTLTSVATYNVAAGTPTSIVITQ